MMRTHEQYLAYRREKLRRSVDVENARGCWEWKKRIGRGGYGQASFECRSMQAHRVAWLVFCGPIPDGALVCHACDNRRCINPDHLWLGTHKDNVADMHAKGRQGDIAGSKNPQAKLTETQVLEIRTSQKSGYGLAKELGVSQSTISLIRSRKNWKTKP